MNCLTLLLQLQLPPPNIFLYYLFFVVVIVVVQAGSLCVCHAHPALSPPFLSYIFFINTSAGGPSKCVKIMPQLEQLDTSKRRKRTKNILYVYKYICIYILVGKKRGEKCGTGNVFGGKIEVGESGPANQSRTTNLLLFYRCLLEVFTTRVFSNILHINIYTIYMRTEESLDFC